MRAAAVFLFALFALVNAGNALHKGGDFDVFLDAGNRLLNATPLYAGSSPGSGVIGPPFHAVFFAPFAALDRQSPAAAALCWYLVNLASLLAGAIWWPRALGLSGVERWSARTTLLPMAAILLPAQTNFEHQNMSPLLLALTGACALGFTRQSHRVVGVALGAAIAIKAFPALLLVPLALKRAWRAAAIAVVVATALTATVAFAYGPAGAVATTVKWLSLAGEPFWPTRMQNQSLFAMLSRISPEHGQAWTTVAAALLVGILVMVCVHRRSVSARDAGAELALALSVAVLVSPIAWDHYWVLMFPAFHVVYAAGSGVIFWSAAVLVTGLSPLTIGRHNANVVRDWSASTIAGLLLVVGVVVALRAAPKKHPPD